MRCMQNQFIQLTSRKTVKINILFAYPKNLGQNMHHIFDDVMHE